MVHDLMEASAARRGKGGMGNDSAQAGNDGGQARDTDGFSASWRGRTLPARRAVGSVRRGAERESFDSAGKLTRRAWTDSSRRCAEPGGLTNAPGFALSRPLFDGGRGGYRPINDADVAVDS
mgnify:CR=1 FL=1